MHYAAHNERLLARFHRFGANLLFRRVGSGFSENLGEIEKCMEIGSKQVRCKPRSYIDDCTINLARNKDPPNPKHILMISSNIILI